jgi:hypothetical protein
VKSLFNPVLTGAPVYPFSVLEERKAQLRAEGLVDMEGAGRNAVWRWKGEGA